MRECVFKIVSVAILSTIFLLCSCAKKDNDLRTQIGEEFYQKDGKRYNLVVVQKEDYMDIGFPYNETELFWLEFGHGGINHIYGLSAMYIAPNDVNYSQEEYKENGTKAYICGTDWVGPYMVKQADSIKNTPPAFTGGWHGSNEDNTGEPTANTIQYDIEKDSVKMNDTLELAASVDVVVTNEIQGYDTVQDKKSLLLETIKYHFRPNSIEVLTTIKCLEHVVIERYYGLQTENMAIWDGHITYGSDETNETFSVEKYSQSKSKQGDSRLNQFRLTSMDNKHQLIVQLDLQGLGNGKYVHEDKPYAFTTGKGKSYFNLVNGIPLELKQGDEVQWRGKYVFKYADGA